MTFRVVRAGAWTFVGNAVGRVLQMVKLLVLARLLLPEDFGLFGIVMLAMAAIDTFTQTGFSQALIQRRDDLREHLDTAWTVQIVRSLVLACLLFASAPLIGWFFSEPRVVPLLRVLCLSKIINGVENIGTIYWQKELEFHRSVLRNFIVSLITIAVGVTLAFYLRNVWALVWSSLAGALVGTVLSFTMHPYRPRFCWDWEQVKELLRYGKWLLGNSIVIYLAAQLDNILVGLMLGPVALGLYAMAYRISVSLLEDTVYAISTVLFPGYAKLQGDPQRLKASYLRIIGLAWLFAMPLCLGLLVTAPYVVPIILGSEWLNAVVPLQILLVAQCVKAMTATAAPLFLGTGKPHYDFVKQAVRAAVLAPCLVPAIWIWGLPGAALSVLMSSLAMLFVLMPALNWIAEIKLQDILRKLASPLTASVIMSGTVYLFLEVFLSAGEPHVMLLVAIIAVGGVIYVVALFLLATCFGGEVIPKELKQIMRYVRRRTTAVNGQADAYP